MKGTSEIHCRIGGNIMMLSFADFKLISIGLFLPTNWWTYRLESL